MTDIERAKKPDEIASIVKRRFAQRIDEILDSATRDDPAGAIIEAEDLSRWLKEQIATGQANPDLPEALADVELILELIRKSNPSEPNVIP